MRKLIAGMLSVAVLSFAGVAEAQEGAVSSSRPSSINGPSVWAVFGYVGAVGAGVRWATPLGSAGLFKGSNLDVYEELALEYGADVVFETWGGDNDLVVIPVLGGMWVFWLVDGKLGLYPKIELGWGIPLIDDFNNAWYRGLYWNTAGGVIYKTGTLTLRAEGGRGLLKLGIGLAF